MEDFISSHKAMLMLVLGVLAGVTLVGSVLGFVFWSRSRRAARAATPPAPPAPRPAGAAGDGVPPAGAPPAPVPYQKPVVAHWTRNAAVVSMILHTAFLVSTVFIVTWRAREKEVSTFKSTPPVRPKLQPRQMEMKVKAQNLQKASGRPRLMPRLVAMTPGSISLPVIQQAPNQTKQAVKRDYAAFGTSGFGYGIGGGDGTGFGGGTGGGLPNLMAARCSEVDRRRRLEAAGGTPQCEEAVIRGLNWLKSQQNQDGSWGKEFVPAMSGLALLAYMGHCETPASPQYGPTVVRGINYLKRLGRKADDGELVPIQDNIQAVYQHAIATYALAECYTMSRDASIAPVLRLAVARIVKGQNGEGGWMYKYGGGVDSSVSAWQIQALKATYLTGLKIAGVEEALNRGVATMKGMSMGNGNFLYRKSGEATDHAAASGRAGLGTLCLQFWKEGKSAEAKRGLDGIMNVLNQYDYHGKNGCMYSWYYHALACYQGGGDYWKRWNAMMMPQLLGNQAGDGSWNKSGGREFGGADETLMRSAFCILMLEAYYRYLPTAEG